MNGPPTLSHIYRQFADTSPSPLYRHVAVALSESDEALQVIGQAPASKRRPALILAALHDVALSGYAPELAAAYAAADAEVAAAAAVDAVLRMGDAGVSSAARREMWPYEPGRYSVLYPAIAEAVRSVDARAVGLIDVGCSAALNLNVDRVGITYSTGESRGDLSSPVQAVASVVGDGQLPTLPIPEVVARIGVARHPLDVTVADDARWLRACVRPDQPSEMARLESEIALAAPPLMLRGDVVDMLPDAVDAVPRNALAVVLTTWSLSRLRPEKRVRFADRLHSLAGDRLVAWVSVEGVGVAPSIPTLGDRPGSGHSITGIEMFDGSERRAWAVGRCWSRGRQLAWLARA